MPETFYSLLTPANNSGTAGIARLTVDNATLHVDVVAMGATPGQVHLAEILGATDGTTVSSLATAAVDANGNGRVEASEAATVSGGTLFDLTLSGTNTHGAVNAADAPPAGPNGLLELSQTYQLDPTQPADAALLANLGHGALALTGLNQASTGAAGTSYDPALPASEGLLFAAPDQLAETAGTPLSWLTGDANAFLAGASAALSNLAPYMLNAAGTGPVAPEPAGVAASGATDVAALLLPSNNSGALGATTVHFDAAAGTVTVDLYMTGLTPNEVHASHIHGFANGAPSLLPNETLDVDRDGFVEDQEGEGVIGPVILALTQDGSVSDATVVGNFPRADANGNLHLQETYRFDTSDPGQNLLFTELEQRLVGREVQVHGLDVTAQQGAGTPYEVHGAAGYVPNLPVANGILLPLNGTAASPELAGLVQLVESHVGASSPAPATAASDQLFA